MANPGLANIDPWGRSLGETLRRWWWVPVVFALIGALLGGLAGAGAPSTATALLRVQSTASNGDGLNQAQQSALAETNTSEVFQAAAQQIGTSEVDLRERAELAAVPESLMIEIRVAADNPAEAVRQANAFAQAAVTASNSRIDDELAALTEATSRILANSRLTSAAAEEARVASLGASLAGSQSQTLAQSRRLSVIQPATEEAVETTSSAVLILLGGVGLGLVGVAVVLFFGGRRGRMRKIGEMRRLYPNLEFIPARDVPAVLSMEAPTPDRLVITGVRTPVAVVRQLVEPVAEGLKAVGRDIVVTQNVAKYGASQTLPKGPQTPTTVLESGLSTAVVKRVARDPEAILLVLVRAGKTRFEWLDEYAGQFGERTYIVVES